MLRIGTRVGGWFDSKRRVSITQQEFRHACELQKAGKLKIITFVRAEVWQARDDRKELGSYLASLPYSDAEKRKIEAYPRKFADDAEFINAFINEVGRARDTVAAQKIGMPLPSGNWIHVFHDFREVIAAVEAQAFSGVPVVEAALRRLLQSEIRELLRQCIPNCGNKIMSPRVQVEAFLRRYPMTRENRDQDFLAIDTAEWDKLTWYAFHLLELQLHPMILETAIVSPFFLKFDPALNAFEETEFHRAIVTLRDEIRRFNGSNTDDTLSVVFEHSPRQRLHRKGTVAVEPKKIAMLLLLFNRWINIIELCIAIYRHLDGNPFVEPSLRPRSPITGWMRRLKGTALRLMRRSPSSALTTGSK